MRIEETAKAPRPAHRLDEAALARYLTDHIPGIGAGLSVRQFEGGQSNPTYLLRAGDTSYVLRKKPPGTLAPKAHAIDRECRIMQALAGTGVPVPAILHYCADPSIVGTEFYVMAYMPGRVLKDPALPGLDPATRARIHDAMNETLARLHQVDWQALDLAGFGKPDDYIGRQVAFWTRQYEATKTGAEPDIARLAAWLTAQRPADDSAAVVHGDYRIENLIFDAQEPQVIAVVDWELSTIGHPLCDLAFNCMAYHFPSGHPVLRGLGGINLAAHGIPSEADHVAAYCRRTGRAEIRDWTYFMAFSLFRVAVIQQGVYRRALEGNASSAHAHLFGESFPIVARAGTALIDGGG